MSARTRLSRSNISRANWNSNSIRKARWPSASARAARAFPASIRKTGVGTLIAEGKEHKEFDGETYILERGLHADLSIVKAWKGDREGNLIYRKTARNFNPMMATAGKVTVAEVEDIVPTGELDPDTSIRPAFSCSGSFKARTTRNASRSAPFAGEERLMPWTREDMAQRAAQELRDGFYVNLGIGIPTLVANYIPDGMDVTLQIGERHARHGPVSRRRTKSTPISSMPASRRSRRCRRPAYFSSADSFAMIRGGHIDLSILGAMEVSEKGDLANWMVPGKLVKGMGGAMDLVAGVKRCIVLMDHTDKAGKHKLLKLHAAADRRRLHRSRHHQSRHVRCDEGWPEARRTRGRRHARRSRGRRRKPNL